MGEVASRAWEGVRPRPPKDGRIVYMTPDLGRLVTAQVARVRELEREMGRIIPWLFPHLMTTRPGTPASHRRQD